MTNYSSNEKVETGIYTAKIVDIEVAENVRFGKYIADVYKPIYRVNNDLQVKDNGVFKYKQVEGFLYNPQKNWGYAKFLNTMGVKRNSSANERFKFEVLKGELVRIEVYTKMFNNQFSKRVQYPVAKVLQKVEVPF
jgi:hypothetical protein|tara:strand:- start:593 stop:1000 length:408 start_codon:yes stop_codon:yes gene_type:complete